jgi:hypothetical protein
MTVRVSHETLHKPRREAHRRQQATRNLSASRRHFKSRQIVSNNCAASPRSMSNGEDLSASLGGQKLVRRACSAFDPGVARPLYWNGEALSHCRGHRQKTSNICRSTVEQKGRTFLTSGSAGQ